MFVFIGGATFGGATLKVATRLLSSATMGAPRLAAPLLAMQRFAAQFLGAGRSAVLRLAALFFLHYLYAVTNISATREKIIRGTNCAGEVPN